jgi:hypothetical protein
MSKRKHLAPVPAAPELPGPASYTDRFELPTGGRNDIDTLLRELARVAFRGSLTGFSLELDRRVGGVRCFVSVQVGSKFTATDLEAGKDAVTRALLVLGVIRPAKPAAAPAAPEDGAPSPPQAPPSSPS